MKARSQPVATVSFVPPAVNTAQPDISKIHSMVRAAIDKSERKGTAAAKPASASKKGFTRTRKQTVGGSIGNLHDGYAANASADLSSAC
jgi:hypothetical protein